MSVEIRTIELGWLDYQSEKLPGDTLYLRTDNAFYDIAKVHMPAFVDDVIVVGMQITTSSTASKSDLRIAASPSAGSAFTDKYFYQHYLEDFKDRPDKTNLNLELYLYGKGKILQFKDVHIIMSYVSAETEDQGRWQPRGTDTDPTVDWALIYDQPFLIMGRNTKATVSLLIKPMQNFRLTVKLVSAADESIVYFTGNEISLDDPEGKIWYSESFEISDIQNVEDHYCSAKLKLECVSVTDTFTQSFDVDLKCSNGAAAPTVRDFYIIDTVSENFPDPLDPGEYSTPYSRFGMALQGISKLEVFFGLNLDLDIRPRVKTIYATMNDITPLNDVDVVITEDDYMYQANVTVSLPIFNTVTTGNTVQVYLVDEYDNLYVFRSSDYDHYVTIDVKPYVKPSILKEGYYGSAETPWMTEFFRFAHVDDSDIIDESGEYIYGRFLVNVAKLFDGTSTIQNNWKIDYRAVGQHIAYDEHGRPYREEQILTGTITPSSISTMGSDYNIKVDPSYDYFVESGSRQAYWSGSSWNFTFTIVDRYSSSTYSFVLTKAGGIMSIERFGVSFGERAKASPEGGETVDDAVSWLTSTFKSKFKNEVYIGETGDIQNIYVGNIDTGEGLLDVQGRQWMFDTGWKNSSDTFIDSGGNVVPYFTYTTGSVGDNASWRFKMRRIGHVIYLNGAINNLQAKSSYASSSSRYKIATINSDLFKPSNLIMIDFRLMQDLATNPYPYRLGTEPALLIDSSGDIVLVNNTGTNFTASAVFGIDGSYIVD